MFDFINKSYDNFIKIISDLNLEGVNITSPLKKDIFKMLNYTDKVSQKVESVNLITNNFINFQL